MKTKLGLFIKYRRNQKGLSRNEFTRLMPPDNRITPNTLGQIEAGAIKRPPNRRLYIFSIILGVQMESMLTLIKNGHEVPFQIKDLSDVSKLTHKSIKRIREYEPEEGYHLAFSGGKDSIVIEHLARRAQVKFTAHMGLTTIDPPEHIRFVKEHYPEVVLHKPEVSMFKLISEVKHGLPLRGSRWCCEYLKEYLGEGELVMQGIRWEESTNRANREIFEVDNREYRLHFKMYLNPIIDWLTVDVWEYIDNHKLPYPEVYDTGQGRIGCVACPAQQAKGMAADLEKYPRFRSMYLKAIRKAREAKKKNGEYYAIRTNFKDEYEALEWWVSGLSTEKFLYNKYQQYKLEL